MAGFAWVMDGGYLWVKLFRHVGGPPGSVMALESGVFMLGNDVGICVE